MIESVKINGMFLEFGSEEIKTNRKIVLEAVKKYGSSLYSKKKLQNVKQIVLEPLKNDIYHLLYASLKLRKNKKLYPLKLFIIILRFL